MDIVFLKLMNGDELFARCVGQEGNQVLLADVMAMEIIATDENQAKYMFMSRYSPYGNDHSMAIDHSKIVFMHEVTETVKNHYETSVNYANQVSDYIFQDGIAEATKYLNLVLDKRTKRKAETKDNFEQVKDRILGTYETSSTTKH